MDDDSLLSHLRAREEDSAAFTWGALGAARERGMREYFRMPYGTEEEGWSSIVTSDVQDTVEWILPALLKIFTSTDKAVSFEPTKQEDVRGAEQATDTCNYVFYKQNNGFLTLYTAFKDALLVKNCAVMWRKETKRVKTVVPVTGATADMLVLVLQEAGEGAEIESATPQPAQPVMGPQGPMADPMTGQPLMGEPTINARISKFEDKTTIKVEAFPPEDLLVQRDWSSPLLQDCPYVARLMRVTLSDLKEMGYKVEAEDLRDASEAVQNTPDAQLRARRNGDVGRVQPFDDEDDSLAEGYLRIEYVLVDWDGDGIAERRCIHRLADKILSNEECSHVPIATASPILVAHRWDGMSVAETVSDLQQLKTELTRQMLNSAYLSNSPRTNVLTDANWSPLANIEDLLDSRPGGIRRMRQPGAIEESVTPWVGGQMFPMLEYIDSMREQRTGVSRASQGIDANVLRQDRTAVEVMQTANAAAARIELIARIFAETLVKPIFSGVLKLLTDGEMEKVAFRLRNEFVEYDPNEWRDSYDTTINVGLGTGDRQQQAGFLQAIFQSQMGLAQSPFGPLLIEPQAIYNTQAKLVENAGFKNVGDFFKDPKGQPLPPSPPPPEIQLKQMDLQAEAQRFQAESQQEFAKQQMESQVKLREQQSSYQLQASNDQRDAERERMQAAYTAQVDQFKAQVEEARHQREMDFQRWKAELEAAVKVQVANIASKAKLQDAATQAATDEIASDVTQPSQDAHGL